MSHPQGSSGRSRLWLWLPVALEAAAIFILSSFHHLPSPPGKYSDKYEHFLTYGLFGALLVRALAGGQWRGVRARVFWWAVVFAALYGASDELHQSFVPGRTADAADLLFDALGAAAAAGLLLAWAIIRRRREAA